LETLKDINHDSKGDDFGFVSSRFIERQSLKDWFSGHRFEVVSGGLEGVSTALKKLRDKKARAVKYAVRVT